MAAFQTMKAWATRNQAIIGIIGTGVTLTSIGLSWFRITTSNKENIKELDAKIEKFDAKIEKYHIENRTERIASVQSLRDFLQFGLSKEISAKIQDKKDDKKDGKD